MKISEYILILFATLVFIGIVSYGAYTMSKIDRLAEQTFRNIQNTHQKVDALANTMQAKYLEIAEQIENKRGRKYEAE